MTGDSPIVMDTAVPAAVPDLRGCSLKRKRPPKIEIPGVLREMQADIAVGRFKGRDLAERDEVAFCGDGVAVLSVQGKKKFMEDAFRVVSLTQGGSKKGFFGVYDGHGGKKAAEFVAEKLHANILELVDNGVENGSKEGAIRAGYLKTDEEFLQKGIGSGTCCATALIDEKEFAVSNLGDCRVVLCRGGVAEALTTDHRPGREDEKQRVEKEGGYVEFHRGAWRIHGVLSVSRSIGDAHLKDWVLAEPETKILDLGSDMEYLVLASDGLWDQVGNPEVVDIVIKSCTADKRQSSASHLLNGRIDQYGCICSSPSPKIKRVSLLKPQDPRCESPTLTKRGHQEGIEDEACGVGSPLIKTRRILSSLRTPTKLTQSPVQSPCSATSLVNENKTEDETESPPSKLRRISVTRRTPNKLAPNSPNQENIVPSVPPQSANLATACRELVNLAVKRGSMDDITVMIIDLNYFRNIS